MDYEANDTLEWRFGLPATPTDLKRLEHHLGAPVPNSLRSFLLETNGIQVLDSLWGTEWNSLYFSVEQMLTDVVQHLQTSGNPIPPDEQLRSVAFFHHKNGFASLNGVCLRSFAEFDAGEIVYLEHESGEFSKTARSLEDFISDSYNCTL